MFFCITFILCNAGSAFCRYGDHEFYTCSTHFAAIMSCPELGVHASMKKSDKSNTWSIVLEHMAYLVQAK